MNKSKKTNPGFVVLAILLLVVQSLAQIEYKLSPAVGYAWQDFGIAVSIDGEDALIGACPPWDYSNWPGSAFIFHWNGTTWEEKQKLTAPDFFNKDEFGERVAIQNGRVVVGAKRQNGTGAAYVFEKENDAWVAKAKLVPNDPGARYMCAVAVDGDYIIAGDHGNYVGGIKCGAAYIFHYNGITWEPPVKLEPTDPRPGAEAGYSVAISGNRAIVGEGTYGAVYVYKLVGEQWLPEVKINSPETGAHGHFGLTVAIDHDIIAIGAPELANPNSEMGVVYLYKLIGNEWVFQNRFQSELPDGGQLYGYWVSLRDNRLLVGAHHRYLNSPGAAYLYRCSSSGWELENKFVPSDGHTGDFFGGSVSTDGNNALVSAYRNSDQGTWSGAAYIYPLENPNQHPIANAGPDLIVECLDGTSASAALDGSASTDPDNDQLEYTWRENGVIVAGPTLNPIISATLAVGSHTIELTVDDLHNCTDVDTVVINVVAGKYLVLKLKDSGGNGLAGGTAKWADGAWHEIPGETDANGNLSCVISNPNFSKIQMTYNQGSIEQTRTQLEASSRTWQTEHVRFELRDHFNALIQEEVGGKLDQGGGYWYHHGNTGMAGSFNVELFARSAAYKFRMTYHYNVSETQFPVVEEGGATVVFKTVETSIKLADHTSSPLSGGNVQIGNGSWFDLGTTAGEGTVTAEMFAGSYKFRMNINGTSQEKTQNIATAVVFQTGNVERDYVYTGTIKASIGGAWRTYWPTSGTSVQLLAGIYKFIYTPDPGGGLQEMVEVKSGQTKSIPWGGYSIQKSLPEQNWADAVHIPAEFGLSQNHPNPFNPTTQIVYQVPSAQTVTLKIYNAQGQFVRTLVNEIINPGTHHAFWDGSDQSGRQVAAGLYVYIMQAGDFIATRKMLYVR